MMRCRHKWQPRKLSKYLLEQVSKMRLGYEGKVLRLIYMWRSAVERYPHACSDSIGSTAFLRPVSAGG